jgi:hypothetical protein
MIFNGKMRIKKIIRLAKANHLVDLEKGRAYVSIGSDFGEDHVSRRRIKNTILKWQANFLKILIFQRI